MIKVTVLCVGKLKEEYWKKAVSEYSKRMGRFADFSVIEVDEEKLPDAPSEAQINNTVVKEGQRLSAKIPNCAFVVAMCIEGRRFSSNELAKVISDNAVHGCGNIVFIIGGSYGLSENVKKSADIKMSMSDMTFPHQLARVMLCEQIYRSFQINSGGKYHK